MLRRILWISITAFIALVFIGRGQSAITKSDILSAWLFDEGSGEDLKDASGNKNDGKLINGPTWVGGKYGKALEFDASKKQRVEVPNSPTLNPTDQITITAWGYLFDTGGNRRFLQKSTPGSDNQYRLLLEWGNFRFDAGPGVTPKEVDAKIFSVNEWHHVAGVYDGKEVALYIDGEKVASKPATGKMTPSDGPIFIGTKHPGAPEGDYWNGRIDEVVIFGKGLSGDEVKTVMKGIANILAPPTSADSQGKLTTTWGEIKD